MRIWLMKANNPHIINAVRGIGDMSNAISAFQWEINPKGPI
jgi:hypothetical protein